MKDEIIEELSVVGEIETDDGREPRRYEIGCLLTPIIAVEAVEATAETLIRGVIGAAGGQIIGGENPKLIPLAYFIRKTVENKNLRFREAYLVSLRFSVTPEKIIELDKIFRASSSVLRFLIVELPPPGEESHRRPKEAIPSSAEESKNDELPGTVMSQADMDREIDGLLATASQS